jgi:CheY-like chemotaxis protein
MGYGRAYEGIGLGLSLVKKVLILNKVQLSTSSIKGKGTTFTMNFGKSALSENIPKTIISPDLAPDAKKLSNGVVLLVEDDFINQSTIKRFLENRYTLLITDSSDGALEILKKNKINLILMDISIMGNKNGLELTKELKASKEYCNIPVIAITAHAFEKDKLNALDAGCDNYLAKPFSKESLLGMIAVYKI